MGQKLSMSATWIAIGGIGSLISAWVAPERFFPNYLVAFLYWLGISLGALGIIILGDLTGGRWKKALRLPLEAAARCLTILPVVALPVVVGAHFVYPWVGASDLLGSPRDSYFDNSFVLLRASAYFLLWSVLSVRLTEGRERPSARAGFTGGAALLLFLSATFAAIDWEMSLQPDWHSTAFGAIFVVGNMLGGIAFAIAMVLGREEIRLSGELVSDLSKLMFVFVVGWIYVSFGQYVVIWTSNTVEGIAYYLPRTETNWQWFSLALLTFYFILPTLVLLTKRKSVRWLATLAIMLLVARYIDVAWTVLPGVFPDGPSVSFASFFSLLFVSGLWLMLYGHNRRGLMGESTYG
ncbi:MAG: hypothetical protein KDD44_11240 [Bdellovibrionales bacterium]|nr:hypothetical protein [Bdellovibrionales bacterium]